MSTLFLKSIERLFNHLPMYPITPIRQSTKKSYIKSVAFLISLLVSLQVTSCKCGNPKIPNNHSEELTMEVSPTSLVEPEKTIEATFFITAGSKNSTALAAYQIRITLTETGGSGSSLNYIDGTKATQVITSSLQETVGHFFSTTALKSNESSLKVPFTLVSGPQVTSVAIQFELLEKKGQVLKSYIVNWQKRPLELRISKLFYNPMSGMVTYEIENTGTEIARGAELVYKNISEDEAEKAVLLAHNKMGTISLGDIARQDSTGERTLPLDFKTADKGKFKFEIIGKNKEVIATREEEFSKVVPTLKLEVLGNRFLIGDERQITCKIEITNHAHPAIELDKLKLLVIRETNSAAEVMYKGTVAHETRGLPLEEDIELSIESMGSAEGSFRIQLVYGATFIGEGERFIWKRDQADATKMLKNAIDRGDVSTMKTLLTRPDIDLNQLIDKQEGDTYNNPLTPLARVIHQGNIDMVKLLISKGVDLNACAPGGMNPLNIASYEDNEAAVKLLLEAGADVNGSPQASSRPIHLASRGAKTKVLKELLKNNSLDIKAKDEVGRTALHFLAGAYSHQVVPNPQANQESLEIIKELIAKGVDINGKTNDSGATPLHAAAHSANGALAVLLESPGIDINAQDAGGDTPLHAAIKDLIFQNTQANNLAGGPINGQPQAPIDKEQLRKNIKLLLEKGARKNIPNNEAKTAVALARESGDLSLINLLDGIVL